MSGPTKKDLQQRIVKLEQENLELRAERNLMERRGDDLDRELERVRSQNKSLAEAKYETELRYGKLIEESQRAIALVTSILSHELPSTAPSQDMEAVLWGLRP